jgi:hypothetical protein
MEKRTHSDDVVAGYLPELPTAGAMVRELMEIGTKLQEATDSLVKWGTVLGDYGPDLELQEARFMLQAGEYLETLGMVKPTVPEKEAWVRTKTEDVFKKAEQAQLMVKIYGKVVDSLKSRLTAAQSISKAFREELAFVRGGQQWTA